MKRFLPIKIHSIDFGIGWWWGSKLFFKHGVVIPSWYHYRRCQKLSGLAIELEYPQSWHKSNDKYRD